MAFENTCHEKLRRSRAWVSHLEYTFSDGLHGERIDISPGELEFDEQNIKKSFVRYDEFLLTTSKQIKVLQLKHTLYCEEVGMPILKQLSKVFQRRHILPASKQLVSSDGRK